MFRDRQALRVLLLALVVVTVTTSLPRGGEGARERREGGENARGGYQFHCCTPPQWTVVVSHTTGSVDHGDHQWSQGTVTHHYDSVNQREAFTDNERDGKQVYQRMIVDYKQQTAAIIINDQQCKKYALTEDFKPVCTPGDEVNVTLVLWAVAPAYQMGYGENTMYYERAGVTGHLVVTNGNCAFIESAEFDYGTPQVSSVKTVQYFNQTLTVQPDVFIIPKSCVSVAPGDAEVSHVMDELKRVPGFGTPLLG